MDKLLCLLYWRVFVQNVIVFVKETSWRRCQLWGRLPVSWTWLFSKTDKNVYGLYVQKTKQSITCVKGGKMVDRQDDESRLVSTLCPANMQIWVNGVIGGWGAVQGWDSKCKKQICLLYWHLSSWDLFEAELWCQQAPDIDVYVNIADRLQ